MDRKSTTRANEKRGAVQSYTNLDCGAFMYVLYCCTTIDTLQVQYCTVLYVLWFRHSGHLQCITRWTVTHYFQETIKKLLKSLGFPHLPEYWRTYPIQISVWQIRFNDPIIRKMENLQQFAEIQDLSEENHQIISGHCDVFQFITICHTLRLHSEWCHIIGNDCDELLPTWTGSREQAQRSHAAS